MYLVEQEGMLRLILEDMCEILMISEAEEAAAVVWRKQNDQEYKYT
jgi:hypothetical protein